MELRAITPEAPPTYYEGMLRGVFVVIRPDPPSIYWDWTLSMESRGTAHMGIIYTKGRSNSLEQAHRDVLEARKLFPKVL